MRALDLIRWALQATQQGLDALVADMHDAPLVQPTPSGGNHPLWLIGHLCYIEGTLRTTLLGEPNPVEHWAPLFAPGTTPVADASKYPRFDEVLSTFRELRAGTIRMLDQFGEAGLDQPPKHVPAGFEDAMTSVGHTILLITLHQMVHYGQLAVARRAAGRKPLL